MANAGQGVQQGQPNAKYYTANSPADLQTAFQQIIGGVVSCELQINGTVDPTQAQPDRDAQRYAADVWHRLDRRERHDDSHLLGAACDTLKNSSNPQVQASFPCGSVIL